MDRSEGVDMKEVYRYCKGNWEERYIEDAPMLMRQRYYCSECGEWNTYGKTNFCPHCGADMREED